MRTLQKLMLLSGNSGGAAAPAFRLTATITAPAQTVTLQQITPTGQDVEISWGDGTVETIADGSTLVKSHEYASAGAYTISLPYVEYATIDIRDAKVGGAVTASNPFPSATSYVRLLDLPNLTWVVSTDNPFPAVTVAVLLRDLPNLTWVVDANNPFPQVMDYVQLLDLPNLTWVVDSSNPFPAVTDHVQLLDLPNLTWNNGAAANLHSVSSITYENNLLVGEVDTVLADLYSVFPARTKVGTIDLLGGGNAAPTGVSPGSAECPPTTGWNTAYELVNDTCGIANFHWTSVSLQT